MPVPRYPRLAALRSSVRLLVPGVIAFAIAFSCARKEDFSGQKQVQRDPLRIYSDTTTTYSIEITPERFGYAHHIAVEMSAGLYVRNGELTKYNPAEWFYGYDTSIIRIDQKYIIPKSVGSTTVYLSNPEDESAPADSVKLHVAMSEGKLILQTDRTP